MSLSGKLVATVELKKVSAADFHHGAFGAKPHHVSNMTPRNIQACNLHEGDFGKPGSVISWNYVHDGKPKVAKEVIEAIDHENFSTTYKVIEGDLMNEFKSFVVNIKATPKGEGCVVVWTMEYEKLHDAIVDPHTLVQFAEDVIKDIAAHLLQA